MTLKHMIGIEKDLIYLDNFFFLDREEENV